MTDNTQAAEIQIHNVQNEMLTVGCMFKDPNLYVEVGKSIVSKYDFWDEVTRFYYDSFELMYKTYSQSVSENTVNGFMLQDVERCKTYRKYGGYRIIHEWMRLARTEDFRNYLQVVKKYSLLREYDKKGFNVQKIMKHKAFPTMKAEDIPKLLRSAVDRINTVILNEQENVNITEGNEDLILSWLIKPSMGLEMPFGLLNEMFRGMNLGSMMALGFLSNEGKTRLATFIACWVAFIKREKIYLLCNETNEEDIRACVLTTIINNDFYQDLHGVKITKKERETVLGIYRDDEGKVLSRYEDADGNFVESEADYINRVKRSSSALRNVLKVAQWIDQQDSLLQFKRLTDYSDESLEFEIRKAHLTQGVDYFIYDTLKCYKDEDWKVLKQTTTMLQELMAELGTFLWCDIQLKDEALYDDIFSFSSNNIANAKQLRHVLDSLVLGKRLDKTEYSKYNIIDNSGEWGSSRPVALDVNKVYYGLKIDKNRKGDKNKIPVLEVDLNLNSWVERGYLVKIKDIKELEGN